MNTTQRLVAALLVLGAAGSAQAQPAIASLTPIELNDANYVTPTGINAQGQVTGYAGFTNDPTIGVRGFVTDSAAGAVTLIDPIWEGVINQVTQANLNSINDAGISVGWSYVQPVPFGFVETHAVLYDGNELIDLGVLGGTSAQAKAINNSGLIAGTSSTDAGPNRAFVYDNTNGMVNLGVLPGGNYSEANDINDAGTAVGFSTNSAAFQVGEAVMWDDGQLISLGSFEGRLRTYASAISENGLVVGSADDTFNSSLSSAAWLYDGNNMHDLGYLLYDDQFDQPYGMFAYDVNSLGQVVGYSAGPSFGRTAFIYSDGTLYPLEDLLPPEYAGWQLRNAYAINDQGWVVGDGFPPNSNDIVAFALRLETSGGCNGADIAEPYGQLDFFDVSAFLNAYNNQDDVADLAEPFGTFNFFDVSAFLNIYNAGCP